MTINELNLKIVDISIRIKQLQALDYNIKTKTFTVGASVFDIPNVSKLEAKRAQLKTELKTAIQALLTDL